MNKDTIKRIIGLLLLIVIFHFIFSNFDVLNHLVGFVVEVQEKPKTTEMQITRQVVTEPLKIRENYFKEDFRKHLFLINISNIDDVGGNVTLTLICNRTNFYEVSKTARIESGESYVFDFDTGIYSCKKPEYLYQAHDVQRVLEE